jgi:hypothetical protein
MDIQEVDLEALARAIRSAGRPLHINRLVYVAALAWLEAYRISRPYAPGSIYRVGETVILGDQRATVKNVQRGENPKQGPFAILTLCLPDGTERLMAAEIPGAPKEDRQPITNVQVDVDAWLRGREATVRQAVLNALKTDPRFVQWNERWCLQEMLPRVDEGILQKVLKWVTEKEPPRGSEPVSHSTEELVRVAWGLEDDGSAEYDLHAFSLSRALATHPAVVNLEGRWTSAKAWNAFITRPPLTPPRLPTQVVLPEGVAPVSRREARKEQERKRVEEPTVTGPEEDLEVWRKNHPAHVTFTLRARHYYEGWLPLDDQVRRLFPPTPSARQEVVFHHRFGDEPDSFRAWVDRAQGRIWVSPEMYETLRHYRIYPGARLRISARNEREYDIATRPASSTAPIRVWRMWLDENGQIQYEDHLERRLYDVDDDVYVADVRFEDQEALFRQAEEVGNSVFGLMYQKACQWWEERGRQDLIVTADELFAAIHFDEKGRMVSKATIAWELWQRKAFEPLGGGRYRFRPEFGEQKESKTLVRSYQSRRQPDSRSGCWNLVRRLVGRKLYTLDQRHPFQVVEIDEKSLHILVETTGNHRAIPRGEIEAAWKHLVREGEITRTEIREQYSAANPAYVAAVLAALPGISYQTGPIRLIYRQEILPPALPAEDVWPEVEISPAATLLPEAEDVQPEAEAILVAELTQYAEETWPETDILPLTEPPSETVEAWIESQAVAIAEQPQEKAQPETETPPSVELPQKTMGVRPRPDVDLVAELMRDVGEMGPETEMAPIAELLQETGEIRPEEEVVTVSERLPEAPRPESEAVPVPETTGAAPGREVPEPPAAPRRRSPRRWLRRLYAALRSLAGRLRLRRSVRSTR